jgi:hypothetical protein
MITTFSVDFLHGLGWTHLFRQLLQMLRSLEKRSIPQLELSCWLNLIDIVDTYCLCIYKYTNIYIYLRVWSLSIDR